MTSVRKLCTGARDWPMPARHSTRASGAKRCVHSLLRRASDVPVRAVVWASSYGAGVAPTLCTSVPSRREWKRLANRIGVSVTESTPSSARHWMRAVACTPPPSTRSRPSSTCSSVTLPSSRRRATVVVVLLLSRSMPNALSEVLTMNGPVARLVVHAADGCSLPFSNPAVRRTSLTRRV